MLDCCAFALFVLLCNGLYEPFKMLRTSFWTHKDSIQFFLIFYLSL